MTKQIGNFLCLDGRFSQAWSHTMMNRNSLLRGHIPMHTYVVIYLVFIMYVHSLMMITAAHRIATNTQALKHLLLWN